MTRRLVLLIANNFPPVRGGSGMVYASIARACNGRVLVLAPRIGYSDGLPLIGWREHDRRATYPIVRIPLLRTVMVRPGTGLRRLVLIVSDLLIRLRVCVVVAALLRRERPKAVCIGELLASSWLVQALALVPGLRTIVYVHGEEITTEDPYDRTASRRRRALKAADGIVVVSEFTRKAVASFLGGVDFRKVALIENGVDTQHFCVAPKNEWLMDSYGLRDHFVFISVCRLLPKKGIDHALEAFARLVEIYPDSRYLIVGSGSYGEALQTLAADLGISELVRFAGEVPDRELVDHYRLGDVFIMPNRELPNRDTEGFGLVFLEANACGLPVIAGQDGGSKDAVIHGRNGLVVDGHSIVEIFHAMVLLREDTALRDALRQGGLAAAARADWKWKAEAFLAFCAKPAALSDRRRVALEG